jgi:hypothetical protein
MNVHVIFSIYDFLILKTLSFMKHLPETLIPVVTVVVLPSVV